MNHIEELMVYISTKDRLGFLKYRSIYIKKYGYNSFKILLYNTIKELGYE